MIEQTRGTGEWIGIDFDGVLATDAVAAGVFPDIGKPIKPMIARVKEWLTEGKDVRIFTARVSPGTIEDCAKFGRTPWEWEHYQRGLIENFCIEQFGAPLPITCVKDYKMIELWDDRCVQMMTDTGESAVAHLSMALQGREAQILTLCSIVGAEAEEELEEKVRKLVEAENW